LKVAYASLEYILMGGINMKAFISAALLSIFATSAGAATITFEDQVLGETAPVTNGFTFSGSATNSAGSEIAVAEIAVGDNGTNVFQFDYGFFCDSGGCGYADINMEAENGGAFSFSGADTFLSGVGSLTIFGYKVGGGLATDPIGTGDWLNLQSVSFSVSYPQAGGGYSQVFEIDNISASVVPIPAAVWLFGSGLGLLGWFRRKTA
jgi:hypothetical protein